MELDNEILFPHSPDASTIIITCQPANYSASVIARAVEDCDAHVINLNILACRTDADELMIALRVDHRNASSVARSLQRFGYDVIDIEAPDDFDLDTEVARSRANELLRYLEI